MLSLFDALEPEGELPAVPAARDIAIDTETTGLTYTDLPVGLSVAWREGGRLKSVYLAWAHVGGGNRPLGEVRKWCKSLMPRRIFMLNALFDLDMLKRAGIHIPYETVVDVAHMAAIHDGNQRMSLDALSKRYLNDSKLEADARNLWKLQAADAEDYARKDAELTLRLGESIPAPTPSGLWTLERAVWSVAARMSMDGAPFDLNTCVEWDAEMKRETNSMLSQVSNEAGFAVNPRSPLSIQRLLRHVCGIREWEKTANGHPRTDADSLRSHGHPLLDTVADVRDIESLRSKFTIPWQAAVRNGRIRYRLNPLRGVKGGAVTGRFSASDINIQQVPKPSKQSPATRCWPLRSLFTALPGRKILAVDASQIELRVFAHYSDDIRLVKEFREGNPDFHQLVAEWTGLPRVVAKNITFARMFGAGTSKIASMMGVNNDHAARVVQLYDRRFPAVRNLRFKVETQVEKNNYVRTLSGRKRLYPDGPDTSSMNALIQGTAADIFKMQLVRCAEFATCYDIWPLFVVHDEIVFDAPDDTDTKEIERSFNELEPQGFSVPIRWNAAIGNDWSEC